MASVEASGEAIEFQGVSKRYGPAVALAGLDLAIAPGEFVSLLGPSGSGKTTTLNILSGLLRPDSGTVLIGGRDVTALPPERRGIAMVFQNYALYPHMTVAENLAFPLRAPGRRLPPERAAAKAAEVAAMLGIDALLARYPKEISGGQQQRVALGRAIVRDPSVFLLDEPLSNLDARLRLRMRRDLKALHQRLSSTIVYVTHDQGEAMSLSDRIAIYQSGELQQVASPHDIYRHPANLFVANFMGEREMNNVAGRIHDRQDGFFFEGGGLSLELGPRGSAWAALAGRAVTLGIRPEGVGVKPQGESWAVAASVHLVEPAGPDQILYAQAGPVEFCGRTKADDPVRPGESVDLHLLRSELYLFDAETGRTCAAAGEPLDGDRR